MSILVIAEHDHRALKSATLNTVAAAQKIGGDIHVLVAGHGASDAAQAASKLAGVAKVLHADAPQLGSQTAENVAGLVTALVGAHTHILVAAAGLGRELGPP